MNRIRIEDNDFCVRGDPTDIEIPPNATTSLSIHVQPTLFTTQPSVDDGVVKRTV
jgi:hypothetical protein